MKRWVDRYLAGDRSTQDHSSLPHTMPAKTPALVTKRLVRLRLRLREGPIQLAARFGVAPSTAHRILVRCRLNRLAHVDRATGEPVRRYEHPHPGSMIHVDVKKLGNIPDGGGWRYRSFLWRDTCAELGITHKRTRPYRPKTNGKIERFHRTLADGWAYARHYDSDVARRAALPAWLHAYNHHRPHSACGNQPPFNRLTNVPGQYS